MGMKDRYREAYKAKQDAQKPPTPRKARKRRSEYASPEEQHSRYLDCGPQAWDDRDSDGS